jgi:4-hydroxy-tetrahydrodipicolinate synthase
MSAKLFTALITPFQDGAVDFQALEALTHAQLEGGVDGLVVCGSTGEAFFLSPQEQRDVLSCVQKTLNGQIPLVAGTSAITPKDTLTLAHQAQDLDIKTIMVVTPPYVKPTQAALVDYFTHIHDNTSINLIVYDNPGRSGVGMTVDTLATLSQLPRVVAIKDSCGDILRPAHLLSHPGFNPKVHLICGEDALTLPYLAQGGKGCISVTSNVAPALMKAQMQAWVSGDIARAQALSAQLLPIHQAMFCQTSPAPAKYGASLLGLCSPEVRAPLHPATPESQERVRAALTQAGLYPHTTEKERYHG